MALISNKIINNHQYLTTDSAFHVRWSTDSSIYISKFIRMEEWIQTAKVGIRNKSQRRDQLLSTSSRKTSLTWHSIHQRAWQLTHVFIPYFSESWTIFLPLLWLYNPKNPFSQIREPFIAFFRARNKLSRMNSAFRLLLHLHPIPSFLHHRHHHHCHHHHHH